MRFTRHTAVALFASALAVCFSSDLSAGDPEAERIMRLAHEARSGWSADFPGFTASAAVTRDADRVEGRLKIQGTSVELDLPAGELTDWAKGQLESIVMHRSAGVAESYDVSFADDVTRHPLGRLIRFHGGSTHSLYRIRDDVITEVHRIFEERGTKFTITVTDVQRNPEGQVLPRHFNVAYWNTKDAALTRNEDFHDDWVRVGRFDLPARRLLVRSTPDKREVIELSLGGHQLLSAAGK